MNIREFIQFLKQRRLGQWPAKWLLIGCAVAILIALGMLRDLTSNSRLEVLQQNPDGSIVIDVPSLKWTVIDFKIAAEISKFSSLRFIAKRKGSSPTVLSEILLPVPGRNDKNGSISFFSVLGGEMTVTVVPGPFGLSGKVEKAFLSARSFSYLTPFFRFSFFSGLYVVFFILALVAVVYLGGWARGVPSSKFKIIGVIIAIFGFFLLIMERVEFMQLMLSQPWLEQWSLSYVPPVGTWEDVFQFQRRPPGHRLTVKIASTIGGFFGLGANAFPVKFGYLFYPFLMQLAAYWLIYDLGRRFLLRYGDIAWIIACVPAFLFAVDPVQVQGSVYITPHTFLSSFVIFIIYAACRSLEEGKLRFALMIGLISAACIFLREEGLFFGIGIFILLFFIHLSRHSLRRAAVFSLAGLGILAAIPAPFLIRNYIEHNQFAMSNISHVSSGVLEVHGNVISDNPYGFVFSDTYHARFRRLFAETEGELAGGNGNFAAREMQDLMWRYFRENPDLALLSYQRRGVRLLYSLFNDYPAGARGFPPEKGLYLKYTNYFFVIIFLYLISLVIALITRRPEGLLINAPVMYFLLFYGFATSGPGYHFAYQISVLMWIPLAFADFAGWARKRDGAMGVEGGHV